MRGDWLDRCERRLGWLALPGLPALLAGMNAVVGVLAMLRPDFLERLTLDPAALAAGELWRVISFLFIPPPNGPLWLAVWVGIIYAVMRGLEVAWGDFRFTVFMLCGAAAMSAAALFWGVPFSSSALQVSVFLAFANLNADMQLMLFFVLPVRVGTLAVLVWLWVAWTMVSGGSYARIDMLAGLANYLLFFGPGHWAVLRRRLQRR